MFLYNMIMRYFDDLNWIGWNHCLKCSAWIDKYFNDYYVLDYVHSGELSLQLDDDAPITLKGPAVWWTFPGPRIRFGKSPGDSSTWNHRFVSFKGSRVGKYIDGGLISYSAAKPFLKISNPKRFASSMDELINYLSFPVYGGERAVQIFEGILLQLHEQRPQPEAFSPPEIKVEKLIRAVGANPEADWDFHEKSRNMNISYSHLRRIFKNLSGDSPNQYVLRARLEKAALLLRKNDLEIKDIASICGFTDIYYFSKLFKNKFKIPPGRFRSGSVVP